jgi:hypothetical protein
MGSLQHIMYSRLTYSGHLATPAHQSPMDFLNFSVSFLGHLQSFRSSLQQRVAPSLALLTNCSALLNKQMGHGGIADLRQAASYSPVGVGHQVASAEEVRKSATRSERKMGRIMVARERGRGNNVRSRHYVYIFVHERSGPGSNFTRSKCELFLLKIR